MTLTTDQITDIADDLETLRNELRTREWSRPRITAVLAAASGNLVSIAAMRAPVPQQQAYYGPPQYPYQDLLPDAGQSVPLQIRVTGSTRQELEDRAHQAGRQVFGDDASLSVTLAGAITPADMNRNDGTQYACSAIIRQEDSPAGAAHYSPRTRESDVRLS